MANELDDSWSGYRRVVIQSFEQLREDIQHLEAKIDILQNGHRADISKLQIDLAVLKTQMILIGVGISIGISILSQVILSFFKVHG
jgi:hypothetical protein